MPELPPVRYVARGYYTSAYYVVEPKRMSGNEGVAPPQSEEKFDPELEPDYFEEFGYPKSAPTPQTTKHEEYQTIVLCHGLAANGLQFVADAHFFAAQGFRVIVPDLRGHGRSVAPEERSNEDFSLVQMSADLLAIMDQERAGSVHWVGNSLGGILALCIIENHQDRLASFTSFGTSYSLSAPSFVVPAFRGIYRLLGAELLARIAAPLTCANKNAQSIVYAMLHEMDVDAVVRILPHVANYDLISSAVNFDGPIMIIRGKNDHSVNQALKPTLASMASAKSFELVDIVDAGHCANLDQPQIVREAILNFIGGG